MLTQMPTEKFTAVEEFSLDHTIASGQMFHYRRLDDDYLVCRRDRLFYVRQSGSRLWYSGIDEHSLRQFLGLDHDIRGTVQRLSEILQLRPAIDACRGLRIVRHDPWECLVSFICSTCSNIPKIARSLNEMARLLGEPMACGEYSDYAFPEPGSLRDPILLRKTGVGYRAEYLTATNDLCCSTTLQKLCERSYPEAREELKKLPGVGDKVADCVCLFALSFGEAFPVDVWVTRAMQELFPQAGGTEKKIRGFAANLFGSDAGYAQQYLFHHQRMINKPRRRGEASALAG
jgi:N-glycosylase/DNA lyase